MKRELIAALRLLGCIALGFSIGLAAMYLQTHFGNNP